MKYNAQKLLSGEYAVFAGSKYFTDTRTPSLHIAEERALYLSAQWYYQEFQKCHDALCEIDSDYETRDYLA